MDKDGLPAPDADRVPLDGLMAHVYTLGAADCKQAANRYKEWANRLEQLSRYYDRLRLRVVHTDFYIKETGIHKGSFISPHEEGSPWLMTTQSCNPNVSSELYQACLANVDLSNRISWYILQRMEATPLPRAQVTGASWLSPYRYAWDMGATPTPAGITSIIEWMPLGRGLVCDGLLPNCPVNEPELDWAVSPNAYGYFLGVHGVKTDTCAEAGFTPVELLTSTVEGGPWPSLEQLSLRGYGPVYWRPSEQTPPSSTVDLLPPFQNTAAFTVSWSGSDAGCGIAFYDVQVRDASGAWTGWLTRTTALAATFAGGQDGHTYAFRVRARDHLGNQEDWPATPDAVTTVDLTAPSSQVTALPTYSTVLFAVSWSGYDATSGVADYDLQVCQGECSSPQESTWNDWLLGTTATDSFFIGEHGRTYHFRSRARDNAGNEELYPDVGDAWTIVDAQPPSTTVEPLDLYTFTTSFTVRWHGADDLSGLNHYNIYYRDESQANWLPWLKGVTSTQAVFRGSPGHTYHFCSQGTDNVGNVERCLPVCIHGDQCGWPIQSDAQMGIAPWSRVDDLPPYTTQTTFPVCWSGIAGQQYDVYVRDGLWVDWVKWQNNTALNCASYQGAYGHVYYFYSVGKNGPGEEAPPYDWDAYTKLVAPTEGEGAAGGSGALVLLPPDEAPDRMEEVTRTQAIGTPLTGYIAPAGDVDWYRFALTATMRLRIELADLPADYDLFVFGGQGQFLWASTWGQLLPEEVVVRVPAGVYYVRLAGYAGAWNGATPYRLLVARTSPP